MTKDEAEQTNGWFRHRLSGQVFEAAGYQYREAVKNRDLEAVDGPDETSDDTPSSKLVALRERVGACGGEWTATDTEDDLNRKLEARAVELRAQAQQLGITPVMANWKPETLFKKVQEATAARTKAASTSEGQ